MHSILRPLPHKARTGSLCSASLLVLAVLMFLFMPSRANTPITDSVGVEQPGGGQVLILHQVEAGETLYAIARHYGQTVKAVQAANPGLDITALRIGQVIRVPRHGLQQNSPSTTQTIEAAQSHTPPSVKPADAAVTPTPDAGPQYSATGTNAPTIVAEAPATTSNARATISEETGSGNKALATVSEAAGSVTKSAATVSKTPAPVTDGLAPVSEANDKQASGNRASEPDPDAESSAVSGFSRTGGQEYRLQAGETLFSLAGTLDMPLSTLLAANPDLDHRSLQAGSSIWIPNRLESNSTSATPKEALETAVGEPERTIVPESPDSQTKRSEEPQQHTVASGETWYGIARQYGLTATALQQANPSASAGLQPGMQLNLPGGISQPGQAARKPNNQPVLVLDQATRPGWTKSRGIATYLSDTEPDTGTGEHLALHNEAAIGSMIDVRNLMNNRRVSAKVVGRLPTNAADRRVVITLSPGAAQALKAHDPRVLVEVAWPSAEGQEP